MRRRLLLTALWWDIARDLIDWVQRGVGSSQGIAEALPPQLPLSHARAFGGLDDRLDRAHHDLALQELQLDNWDFYYVEVEPRGERPRSARGTRSKNILPPELSEARVVGAMRGSRNRLGLTLRLPRHATPPSPLIPGLFVARGVDREVLRQRLTWDEDHGRGAKTEIPLLRDLETLTRLKRVAKGVVEDATDDEVEDLVGLALERVSERRLGGYRYGHLMSYLGQVVRLEARSFRRQDDHDGTAEAPSQDSGPANQADARRSLATLLEGVSEQDLQMLALRAEGREHHEIADALGLSHDAARTRWSRFRSRLKARHPELWRDLSHVFT